MVEFSVPESWYDNVYEDLSKPCGAGRSFSMVHKESGIAALLIHGFMGYPGELVRPAADLYEKGISVYVPRLPGHGTTGKDFRKSRGDDWVGCPLNAARDLRSKYDKLFILGHSMGGTIASIVASEVHADSLVLAAPAIAAPGDKPPIRLPIPVLKALSLIIGKKKTGWKSDPSYRMHYEGAPCDDEYLGKEYWSYAYTRQLLELWGLMSDSGKCLSKINTDTLIIVGSDDKIIDHSVLGYAENEISGNNELIEIEGGTHYLFYDRDPDAEEEAVRLVLNHFTLSCEA